MKAESRCLLCNGAFPALEGAIHLARAVLPLFNKNLLINNKHRDIIPLIYS